MGIFSRKPKPHPVIETQGLRIEYHLEFDWWEFCHEGTEFISYGPTFACPTHEQLASIHRDLRKLKPQMLQRLADGWKEWQGVRMDDGEQYAIDLSSYHSGGGFAVRWSGGSTWGDMVIVFVIRDQAIADESWAD